MYNARTEKNAPKDQDAQTHKTGYIPGHVLFIQRKMEENCQIPCACRRFRTPFLLNISNRSSARPSVSTETILLKAPLFFFSSNRYASSKSAEASYRLYKKHLQRLSL